MAETVKLERIMVQPGWLLVAVNPDDSSRARIMSFPRSEPPRLSDGEALVSVDENAIELHGVALPPSVKGKIGKLFLVPAPQIGGLIAPEPAELVLPIGAKP